MKQTESVSSTVATQQNAIKSEIDQIYDVIAESRGYHPGEPGALASICYAACSLIGEKFGEEGIPVIANRLESGGIANNLIKAITLLLDKHRVRSEEALSIFPEVFLRVRNNGPEPRENHLETIFEMRVFSWFRAKVKEEISSLELADRVADVEKRIYRVRNLTKEISYACYEGALFSIKSDLEAEIEIESKRIENASKLKLKNEKPDDTEPDFPNKFKRKEVMALLQDLIPDFKEADHVAKAAFIVKLTPYRGEAKIAQEYSYLRRDDYLQLVEVWKDKFRKSGRGRNKRTT